MLRNILKIISSDFVGDKNKHKQCLRYRNIINKYKYSGLIKLS
ncbi:hypothetical protein NEISICOT_02067 [Neisseria sicca ATCC 29256]|uniref:Uncharacterized protein n=1 Tax=Neisseria sicca ATCC 29256 TaxID=547045 RepID=C6M6B5_NEISI|nr:hypothetical protein NEISICOT_02067 [Neisseria sicca ATCC 29256]